MHIGLIGGIGPAATTLYYRQLAQALTLAGGAFDLTIVHADLNVLLQNFSQDRPSEQAQEFCRLGQRLRDAGAEAMAITSIAVHFCIPELEPIAPLPIVDAISTLAGELNREGLTRVGVLGTRSVMTSHVYGGLSDCEVVLPCGSALDAAHDLYIAMGTSGEATPEQRQALFAIGRELCRGGKAETVVLAGTDLFVAFDGHACGFPTVDCARAHIEAITRWAGSC